MDIIGAIGEKLSMEKTKPMGFNEVMILYAMGALMAWILIFLDDFGDGPGPFSGGGDWF